MSADAVDLREGGRWTRGQALKNDALYAAASLALAATRPLPRGALVIFGRLLGWAAYALAARARRTAAANVERAMACASEAERRAIVRRAFVTLGGYLGDAVALLHGRGVRLAVDPDAARLLEEARRPRGVVFASAHLGPWENVAASLVAAGVPLVTLARESYDPRLGRLVAAARARQGVRAIHRGEPGAAARIVRALRSEQVLGAPMDLRSRVPSVRVPLLGHEAPTAVGPARIALRTGAAVVVGTAAPDGPRALRVTATAIPSSDLRPGPEDERELTARINAELSRRILALPHSWVWMHPRWEDRG